MSVRVDNPTRPSLRLILGGASVTTQCPATTDVAVCDRLGSVSDRNNTALSARVLLALVPHAKGRRYWLIDPIPLFREIAAGAPLTPDCVCQLDVVRDALAAQLRGDDAVGQALLVGLRTRLQDVDSAVAATAAALGELGDSAGARLLLGQLEAAELLRTSYL